MPRPSSPVCAKASTNCPYLTLESPHHQHQRRTILADHQLGRATQCGCQGNRWSHAPSVTYRCGCCLISARLLKRECTALLATPALRPSLRSRPTPRGIDFKNPFTMSKRSVSLQHPTLARRDLLSSSLGISRRHVARRGLRLKAQTASAATTVVELIGIEPMT